MDRKSSRTFDNTELNSHNKLQRDLQQLIKADASVKQCSDSQIHACFDSVQGSMVVLDNNGHHVAGSPAAYEPFFWPLQELVKQQVVNSAVYSNVEGDIWPSYPPRRAMSEGSVRTTTTGNRSTGTTWSPPHVSAPSPRSVADADIAEHQALGGAFEHDQMSDPTTGQKLAALITVNNQLNQAETIDELCRMAVELGRGDLGFDRLSIWLANEDGETVRGSYGITKDGALRDEREAQHTFEREAEMAKLFAGKQQFIQRDNVMLRDHHHRVEGYGAWSIAAICTGNDVLGYIRLDNLMSQKPLTEDNLHMLYLFATLLAPRIQNITQANYRSQELASLVVLTESLRKSLTRKMVLATATEHIYTHSAAIGALFIQWPTAADKHLVKVAAGDFSTATYQDVLEVTKPHHQELYQGNPILLKALPDSGLAFLARTKRLAIVPLVVQEAVTGMLLVAYGNTSADDPTPFLHALNNIIADALQRTTLADEVQVETQQLQGILESAPIGLFLLDHQSRILMMNRQADTMLARMTDARTGEIVEQMGGRPVAEFLNSAAHGTSPTEIVIDGAVRQVYEVQAHPLEQDKAELTWVFTIQDVTATYEDQERLHHRDRLAAIGQLAAGIAHDFNNLTAVIVLYTQMMQHNSNLDEGDMKRLGVIHEQATRASHLVRQILDFSHQSVMARRQMDMVSFLEDLMTLWHHTLPENIQLELRSDNTSDLIVNGDATRLQQVFMNLAVNARDAMPQGGELRFTVSRLDVDASNMPLPQMQVGAWVAVAVSDSGSGIPPENLTRIFDPFFTTKGHKGTGLGLAQVFGIVQEHDGTIRVQSQNGQGTTFTVYLPMVNFPSIEATDESYVDQNPLMGRNHTVLLVEDYAPTRQAIRAILETYAFHVIEAQNGQQGIELFCQHQDEITLVLSDLVMPDMGGKELYHTLRDIDDTIKMVILTGYHSKEGEQQLLQEGIAAWVRKPFTIEELTAMLIQVLPQ